MALLTNSLTRRATATARSVAVIIPSSALTLISQSGIDAFNLCKHRSNKLPDRGYLFGWCCIAFDVHERRPLSCCPLRGAHAGDLDFLRSRTAGVASPRQFAGCY